MSLHSVNNLLNGAMRRANIGRQVTAAIIVSKANELLPHFLPEGGKEDAKVISFVRGAVTIRVKDGFVCEYLREVEKDFLDQIELALDARAVESLKYRIGFPNDYDF